MVKIRIIIHMDEFNTLPKRIQMAEIIGVQVAATQVSWLAKMLAPVGATGALRATIMHFLEGGIARVVAPVPYSLFQEMGTRKMAAHPFLRPALEGLNWQAVYAAMRKVF